MVHYKSKGFAVKETSVHVYNSLCLFIKCSILDDYW